MSLIVAFALNVAGCGENGNGERKPGSTGATARAGAPAAGPTGTAPGERTPPPETGTAAPDDPGAGDEEPVGTPVQMRLEGGGVARGAPRAVHVAPFIAVQLELRAIDEREYEVRVRGPGGMRLTARLEGGGSRTVPLEGLRAGESYRVTVGDESVRVIADAEPGP